LLKPLLILWAQIKRAVTTEDPPGHEAVPAKPGTGVDSDGNGIAEFPIELELTSPT